MLDLEVKVKFCSAFEDKDGKIAQKLASFATKGSITLDELNDLVPGMEHRKIAVKSWHRDSDGNPEKLVLVLES